VEPGSGSRLPRQKLGTKINQSFKLYILILILAVYFYFTANNYYSHLDLLAPEEGEEDTTPLGEEEAMRILEQQNDEEEQEKGETPKPSTSRDPDAGTATAPPPPPPRGCCGHWRRGSERPGGRQPRAPQPALSEESCLTRQSWLCEAIQNRFAKQLHNDTYLEFYAAFILYHP
jgi:hypothetical protein